MTGTARRRVTASRLARTHLIGIGGAGMSAIARMLVDRGLPVSGSDAKRSAVLTGLAARGVRTAVGHWAENLDLLDGGPTARGQFDGGPAGQPGAGRRPASAGCRRSAGRPRWPR